MLTCWDEAGDPLVVMPPMSSSLRSDGGTSSLGISDVGDNKIDAAAVGGEVNLRGLERLSP